MTLSHRFEEAFLFATDLHRNQLRKGTSVPYMAHLMGVAALVLSDGGNEDEAIAGLLHDAAEDQGGISTLEEIRRRFGNRVADIVDGCTDTYDNPKPPWRKRKESYIAHLRTASPNVKRVLLADKLNNAQSILHDLRRSGEVVWNRFNGGKEGTLWYYRALVEVFRETYSSPLVDELAQAVKNIEAISGMNHRL